MSDDENDVPEETFLGLQQDEDDFLSQVLPGRHGGQCSDCKPGWQVT